MKKGEIVEGIIERAEFPNKGILETKEGKVVVKNTIPGQKVRAVIQKVRKGKTEGRVLELLEKSKLEIDSFCPHFGQCGGCAYQSLPYEQQLRIKEEQVINLFQKFFQGIGKNKEMREDLSFFEGIKGSPKKREYRNKMEFSFGDQWKGGPLTLGMHKRESFYDIVSVSNCQIMDGDYRKILGEVQGFFEHWKVPYYHKMKREGYLRHLIVRKGENTGEILILLVTTSQREYLDAKEEDILNQLKDNLLSLSLEGKIVGILHVFNDSLSDAVKNEKTVLLYGQDYFTEEILGMKFKISPFSFFQTNSLGAEVLYDTVREYVGGLKKDKLIFDLYSGTGTIAQILAPMASKVVGVELVEEAVEAAKENGARNGLNNCVFISGDVLKVLDDIKEKPDLIVLDPPRDGVHPKALPKILNYGVKKIVYISCKPTSLMRDLEFMYRYGYELERGVCIDLFPGTTGVETVVMLSHKKTDSVINVKVEFGEGEGKVPLDNIAKRAEAYKPKERVTYKMIKEYIEVKYGFKVHTAYIAEVKRELGLPMYDAPNAVEELKQPRKHPTAEKVEAIKDALKYFEIIY